MKWRRPLLLFGGLALCILIGLGIIYRVELQAWVNREMDTTPAVGQKAPDFSLADLKGMTVRLDDFRGKVVIINFWATWCAPCREEMPLLQQFALANSQDAVVIGIDLDEPEDLVTSFVEQYKIDFPILMDAGGKVADRYVVHGFPTSILINPEGKITAIHIGKLTQADLSEFGKQAGLND
jgi:peroxiredoxin